MLFCLRDVDKLITDHEIVVSEMFIDELNFKLVLG